ncbi:MAG: glycosyltransferase [Bifidobacterium sp.]
MDAFLLPSLYEGLGIVYVEAQMCAGLPCFASADAVPPDAPRSPICCTMCR